MDYGTGRASGGSYGRKVPCVADCSERKMIEISLPMSETRETREINGNKWKLMIIIKKLLTIIINMIYYLEK